MKLTKFKLIKKILIILLSLIALITITYLAFTNFYPTFGGDVSKEKQDLYQESLQFKDGIFHNVKPVPKALSFSETMNLAYTFLSTKVVNGRPKNDLTIDKLDSTVIADYNGEARLVWFGHSSFLLQIDGQNILIDPMFGQVAAPHPLLGANRFNENFPLEIEKLPQIDAVIFSHDHYDHLDYETVKKIKNKTGHFYTPLGVGTHLEAWGVPSSKITELDWWEDVKFESITLVCTPAQHFSGRKLNNNQSTLWSSWVIQSKDNNIFFSGDSGYANHFLEIGAKYGPFDIALMECGQYDEMWPDVHMTPEETALAGVDVKADKLMPIHWAGFKLALHEWTDPIKRVKIKAKELNLDIITPQIGQKIVIKDSINTFTNWWENL
jgi:L-ascorbate metabolism protein UlaG (beta-lactamase superfamily)